MTPVSSAGPASKRRPRKSPRHVCASANEAVIAAALADPTGSTPSCDGAQGTFSSCRGRAAFDRKRPLAETLLELPQTPRVRRGLPGSDIRDAALFGWLLASPPASAAAVWVLTNPARGLATEPIGSVPFVPRLWLWLPPVH